MAKKKITCQSFLDDLSEYIDGDLASEIRVTFEAHLAKCPDCWVVLDETQKTVEIIQRYDCHPMPEAVKDRLLEALSAKLSNS